MLYLLLLFFLFFLFLINPEIAKSATTNSFNLWLYSYIPNIFIYLILTDLISESTFFNKMLTFPNKTSNQRILKAFMISLIAGIIPASNLLKNTKEDKKIIFPLMTCSTLNPAFILVYANLFIRNSWICLGILLCNIVFNAILFFMINRNYNFEDFSPEAKNKVPLLNQLLSSIEKNFLNILKILGILIFINLFCEMILYFQYPSNTLKIIVVAICANLEVINGLNLIQSHFNGITKILLSVFSISFLGLSIHFQSIFLLQKNCRYLPFFLYNLLKALVITALFYLILI